MKNREFPTWLAANVKAFAMTWQWRRISGYKCLIEKLKLKKVQMLNSAMPVETKDNKKYCCTIGAGQAMLLQMLLLAVGIICYQL